MATLTHTQPQLPASPLDHFVAARQLDEPELHALLDIVDSKLPHADRVTRRLLQPCRDAIIGELRAR